MVTIYPEERIDHLLSADLAIIQSNEVFSFSLDALFLAHFAQIPPRFGVKILDLCAGNGAVTMLIAAKTKSQVMGIELQERLVNMACRSVEMNHMSNQVQVVTHDIRQLDQLIDADSVDIITCNPPYFEVSGENKLNPNPYKAIARHEKYLTMEEFIPQISRVLKVGGRANIVHRPERFLEMIDLLREYRLTPKKIQFVYPKKDREAKMMLVEAMKDGKQQGLKLLPPLFIHDDEGNYLPEVREIIYGSQR